MVELNFTGFIKPDDYCALFIPAVKMHNKNKMSVGWNHKLKNDSTCTTGTGCNIFCLVFK